MSCPSSAGRASPARAATVRAAPRAFAAAAAEPNPAGMLEITLPEENPRLNELQRSLLSAQHGPGTVPNESVLSGHSARNRAQVVHPGGSVVAGSIGRGSIGRLSRFSTTAGDTLSRKAHVISLIANTCLLYTSPSPRDS